VAGARPNDQPIGDLEPTQGMLLLFITADLLQSYSRGGEGESGGHVLYGEPRLMWTGDESDLTYVLNSTPYSAVHLTP
jgi:hypothetical protein